MPAPAPGYSNTFVFLAPSSQFLSALATTTGMAPVYRFCTSPL